MIYSEAQGAWKIFNNIASVFGLFGAEIRELEQCGITVVSKQLRFFISFFSELQLFYAIMRYFLASNLQSYPICTVNKELMDKRPQDIEKVVITFFVMNFNNAIWRLDQRRSLLYLDK